MLILNGAYRGTKATLEAINTEKFSVTVKLAEVRCVKVSVSHILLLLGFNNGPSCGGNSL